MTERATTSDPGTPASSVLAALAASAAVVLTGATPQERVAAAALAAGVWFAGVPGLRGRRMAASTAAACGVLLLALFAYHTLRLPSPFRLRALHTGGAALYAAVVLAWLVRAVRITDQPRALLLAFSLVGSLYVADLLIPRRVTSTTWDAITMRDPLIGFRYVPHTEAATYYPDNPRGYFWQTDPEREIWALETHEAAGATIAHVEPGRVRFQIWVCPRTMAETRGGG